MMNFDAGLALLSTNEFAPLADCRRAIESWVHDTNIDLQDREEIVNLIHKREITDLRDRFYRTLEFGTGGLRGVVGAGINRMNVSVIRQAIQGLANYIISKGPAAMKRGVTIAYDNRRFSDVFSREAACVLAANDIQVYIFPTLQTTPCLSFAIRKLNCTSGLCVTASHNPPQYNGCKVYWEDGAQITPPVDGEILAQVAAVTSPGEARTIPFSAATNDGKIRYIDDSIIDEYYQAIDTLRLYNNVKTDLKIVFTPLHGTGAIPARTALTRWGFRDLHIVPSQEKPDENFPTVEKPNPEEPPALRLAVEHANEVNADVIFATDPDSDRFALIVRDPEAARGPFASQALDANFVMLNGNQTGALLITHILTGLKATGRLKPSHKIIKTIVTSELHRAVCQEFGVEIFDTLTGFKWIAGLVRQWETSSLGASHEFLYGTEESFGYMPGSYVRDKDGIASCCQAAEMAALAKEKGKSLCSMLLDIFSRHGAWQETLINVDLVGEEGGARIRRMMASMRSRPLIKLAGSRVTRILDFLQHTVHDVATDGTTHLSSERLTLPSSDVLQLHLEDGSRVSMRPSGTEPKIKFYASVCVKDVNVTLAYEKAKKRIEIIRQDILRFVDSVE